LAVLDVGVVAVGAVGGVAGSVVAASDAPPGDAVTGRQGAAAEFAVDVAVPEWSELRVFGHGFNLPFGRVGCRGLRAALGLDEWRAPWLLLASLVLGSRVAPTFAVGVVVLAYAVGADPQTSSNVVAGLGGLGSARLCGE
jgi:hypothetical protein